jgi:hypothetical protein
MRRPVELLCGYCVTFHDLLVAEDTWNAGPGRRPRLVAAHDQSAAVGFRLKLYIRGRGKSRSISSERAGAQNLQSEILICMQALAHLRSAESAERWVCRGILGVDEQTLRTDTRAPQICLGESAGRGRKKYWQRCTTRGNYGGRYRKATCCLLFLINPLWVFFGRR